MRKLVRLLLVCGSSLFVASAAPATIIPFILDGNAGFGLLPGNENPAVAGGSGGILSGISFDTDTSILTIDVGWGSGNGFTDLTGPALVAHIHGPTADPAPTSYGQNAGTLYDLHSLPGWDPSGTSGGFNGTVSILPADVSALLEGRTYINVHTLANSNGEIRGQLVAVPEPSSLGLLGLGLAGLVAGRRRSRSA